MTKDFRYVFYSQDRRKWNKMEAMGSVHKIIFVEPKDEAIRNVGVFLYFSIFFEAEALPSNI
jgi:hypothetical protein